MAETKNLHLYVTDDEKESFRSFRQKLAGVVGSNMEKIDHAFEEIKSKFIPDAIRDKADLIGGKIPLSQIPDLPDPGVTEHDKLKNRDLPDQHSMAAITGLEDALAGKQPKGSYVTSAELESVLKAQEAKNAEQDGAVDKLMEQDKSMGTALTALDAKYSEQSSMIDAISKKKADLDENGRLKQEQIPVDAIDKMIGDKNSIRGTDGRVYNLTVQNEEVKPIVPPFSRHVKAAMWRKGDVQIHDEPWADDYHCIKMLNRITGETSYPWANGSSRPWVQPFMSWPDGRTETTTAHDIFNNPDQADEFSIIITTKKDWLNISFGRVSFAVYWDGLYYGANDFQYITASDETSSFTEAGGNEGDLGGWHLHYSHISVKDTAEFTKNWPQSIAAVNFCADGRIEFLYSDIKVGEYKMPNFKKWLRSDFERYNVNFSGSTSETWIITGSVVTLKDLEEYNNVIVSNLVANDIKARSSIYVQPGYEVQLYASKEPVQATDEIYVSADDPKIVSVENQKVKGLADGSTNIRVSAGPATKIIPVCVGSETDQHITSVRTIKDVVITNPIAEMQVGDNWPLYAIALQDSAIPYAVDQDNVVKIASNNTDVLTTKFGVLMARAPGDAIITCTDHTGTISTTMTVKVVPADQYIVPEHDTYHVDDRRHNIYNDGTHPQETTIGIQAALDYAVAEHYRKVVFNNGIYLCNADYGIVTIPTGMVVDFQNATIKLEFGEKTKSGYAMIHVNNCDHSVIRNLTVIGENAIKNGGNTSNRALDVYGDSLRCRFENCNFSQSPGFNVSVYKGLLVRIGWEPQNIEAGDITDDGLPASTVTPCHWRSKDFINISRLGDTWGLGNMQGYQGYYLSSRLFDAYFYDSNKKFIKKMAYCVQYNDYDKPEGAMYCKLVAYQENQPTNADPDFNGVAHLYSVTQPTWITFSHCTFSKNTMTGISPQGAIGLRIDDCTFIDNGSQDPFAHIDWEDGRQVMQGHVISNCRFEQTDGWWHCNIEAPGGGRNIAMYGNTVIGGPFSLSENCVHWRVFDNDLRKASSVSLSSKGDMVFAGNAVSKEPSVTAPIAGEIHMLNNDIL